jgi:hypothetical protein
VARDPRRRRGRLSHAVKGEIFRVGVAGGFPAHDADAHSLKYAARGTLHRLFLEEQTGGLTVLEV